MNPRKFQLLMRLMDLVEKVVTAPDDPLPPDDDSTHVALAAARQKAERPDLDESVEQQLTNALNSLVKDLPPDPPEESDE